MTSRRSVPSRGTTSSALNTSTSYLDENESQSISSRSGTRRPKTGTKTTSTGMIGDQQIICALSEARGISPVVGLAFVNLSTSEAVLCQIVDSQTYVKTLHKLHVFEPTEILIQATAVNATKTKLLQVLEVNLMVETTITSVGRRFWDETAGLDYIHTLAFKEDVEAIKVAIGGNFYATCCFSAALKFIESNMSITFASHSMRIKYEPSDGTMMMDMSTIRSLELVQNIQKPHSKQCLMGLLNQTLTPMGQRMLKGNILQPLTSRITIEKRYEALEELTTSEEMFHAIRQALKPFMDVDRVLTDIVIIPVNATVQYWEQSINRVILIKQYIKSIPTVYEALEGCRSELLRGIRQFCASEVTRAASKMVDDAINEDITYQKKPLDLRNQRTYAVKAGVNGLLDVARQTYKEANQDAYQLLEDLAKAHDLGLELKFDHARQFYFTFPASDLDDRTISDVFINLFRKKTLVECQTLDLLKLNQKILDSHHEVLSMSNHVVQELTEDLRGEIAPLFKISESIAMLDVLASLTEVATTQDYCKPILASHIAIKAGRHPLREKYQMEKYVPNDVYATQVSRLQIITGCNMSGKSTYIRSIALMTIMAQIGSFVPAEYASFAIRHQLFARISLDDSSTSNVSTFAAEMRETAFILRNIDARSLVIIDELGRGTSTRDGLAIAIAVAEALVQSNALIWFVTHFRDLAAVLKERPGVTTLHLASEIHENKCMTMLYRIASGVIEESHYGIILAQVAGLPTQVLEIAEHVSKTLERNKQDSVQTNRVIIQARRRKLVLGLKEQLTAAKESNMQGEVLRVWLKQLQDEFVRRMSCLDDDQENLQRIPDESTTDDNANMLDDVANEINCDSTLTADGEAENESMAQVLGPPRIDSTYVHRPISSRSDCVYTPTDVDRELDAMYEMHGAL